MDNIVDLKHLVIRHVESKRKSVKTPKEDRVFEGRVPKPKLGEIVKITRAKPALQEKQIPLQVADSMAKAVVYAIGNHSPSFAAYVCLSLPVSKANSLSGLKSRVAHFLVPLKVWKGEEARACKKILKKWSQSKD